MRVRAILIKRSDPKIGKIDPRKKQDCAHDIATLQSPVVESQTNPPNVDVGSGQFEVAHLHRVRSNPPRVVPPTRRISKRVVCIIMRNTLQTETLWL